MVVKVKGEFQWHKHDETDDFFLVLQCKLQIRLRDRVVTLSPGELFGPADPENVARCIVAICHPATYWMTGNTLHVDGGESIVG